MTLTKAEVLAELVKLMNERRPRPIAQQFSEDFYLDDAGSGVVQAMFDDIFSLAADIRYDMLDMEEASDRVAVRCRATGTRTTGSFDVAMIAIYRFANERIAEDWGVWSGKPWQGR